MKDGQSIRDVQEFYFEFIHRQFSDLYEFVVTRRPDLSMADAAKFFASNVERQKYACEILPEFLAAIREFWTKAAANAVTFHLQDFSGLKTVFGGDLFPVVEDALISTSAIYSDTIVVPDPFMQSEHVFRTVPDHLKAYYFFKAGLNLCAVARLALADVNPPILCVLPSAHFLDDTKREFSRYEMSKTGLAHAAYLFDRTFESQEELLDFASTLDDMPKLKRAIARPDGLVLNAEHRGSFEENVESYLRESHLPTSGMAPGVAIALNAVGRMGQAGDLLSKARELGGVPIIEAPTSWQYFKWRMEYGADWSVEGQRLADEHVMRGLVDSPDAPCLWIGKLPDDALIELRRTGAFAELRAKLAAGVREMVERSPDDYQSTSQRVYGNIDQLLSEHAVALKALREREWTFAGTDVLKAIVYGTVSVASAVGIPLVSLVNTFIEQTEGTPKLADLPQRFHDLKDEGARLKNSVVGLMFSANANPQRR